MTEPVTGSAPSGLDIRNLSISYRSGDHLHPAVRDVSLSVAAGEIHGLIGESGSGKTTIAKSVLRILPEREAVESGQIFVDEIEVTALRARELGRFRGSRVGYVPQESGGSLNPYQRIGAQLMETIRTHLRVSPQAARRQMAQALRACGLPDVESVAQAYPHQLSMGMCQRVLIALALCSDPGLLVADEPTASLDSLTAEGIIELLRTLSRQRRLGILIITHDFNVLFSLADRTTVLYAGEIVESAPSKEILEQARHPYTQALLSARLTHGDSASLTTIAGEPPDPGNLPDGCPFHPRCPEARERCRSEPPFLFQKSPDAEVRCFNRLPALGDS